jgi:hypothetical protein
LYNRSDHAVDLSGWSLAGGIQYNLPDITVIDPNSYLVIAPNVPAVQALYPAVTVVGGYQGGLSNRSDTIDVIDQHGNLVDHVTYFDHGRWSEQADGGGASLELSDPFADNNSPEAWVASRESGPWQTVTFRGVMQSDGGTEQYREFIFGLLDSGQVLIDDVSIIESPDSNPIQLMQNGTFQSDSIGQPPSKWRINGTHQGTVVADPDDPGNRVLLLQATGAAEDRYNHAETTFIGNRAVVNGRTYEVSFRARWLSGSNQLHSRFYFNRLPRTTLLEVPQATGTPGAVNSTRVANLGPTYENLSHSPVIPAAGQPVSVLIDVRDED